MTRIPPQPPEDWSASTQGALSAVVGVGGVQRPVHLPAVIAHHPTFLAPYLEWAKTVALRGVLPARDNELLALRTAFRCSSAFEWGVHTQYALGRQCLTAPEIEAIAGDPATGPWTGYERALLRAADELHDLQAITDDTWQLLALDEAGYLEVLFIVGHYTMLCMVTNGAQVAPDPVWPAFGRGARP